MAHRSVNLKERARAVAQALPISIDFVAAATEELLILAEVDRHAEPVPGKFFGIVGQDPSHSECNRSHVVIFRQLPWLVRFKAPEILPSTTTGQRPTRWLVDISFSSLAESPEEVGCGAMIGELEPAVSYRWIGWVWEITGWSSSLQENYRSLGGIYGICLKLI